MKKLTIVLLFWTTVFTYGQTEGIVGQSRFLQLSNPSYFGLNHLTKIGVLYNTATLNDTDRINHQYAFGAIAFPDQNFSLGIDINSYKIENVDLNSTLGRFSFVYAVQVDQQTYFLPAITLGFKQLTTRLPGLIFEDQINRTTGFISSETNDPLGQNLGRINYLELGASFLLHSTNFFAGVTFFHLNEPNTSFDKETVLKIPLSLSFQAGFEFDINQYQRGFLPENSFLFLYQSARVFQKNLYFNFAQEFQFESFQIGATQVVTRAEKLNLNAIGLNLGLGVENFDFGFQYNFPIQKLNELYAPSVFELFLVFDFSPFRRNKRGFLKRLQVSNY